MEYYNNFTDILSEIKKKSALQGTTPTYQEVAGAAAGYSDAATNRLNAAKQTQIQQQNADTQAAQLAEMKRQANLQYAAAKDASKNDMRDSLIGAGGALAYRMFEPQLPAVGSMVTSAAKSAGSWLMSLFD